MGACGTLADMTISSWRNIAGSLFCLSLVAGMSSAAAQDNRNVQGDGAWKRLWFGSALALAGAEAMDAASSQGASEANPLLRNSGGQFSITRGITIKGLAVGGVLLFEAIVARHHPGRDNFRIFTIANSAGAAALGAVAVHNYQVTSAPPAYLVAH